MSTPTTQPAIVRQIIESGSRLDSNTQTTTPFQVLELQLTAGSESGKVIKLEASQAQATLPPYQVNDRVFVTAIAQPDATLNYTISDFDRRESLGLLGVLFVVLVLGVSRWRGFLSLVAMALSFVIIFKLTLPLIMVGWHPVVVSALTAALIIPVSFYLSHGISQKTHIAIIGTVISLIVTSLLAWWFITAARLTGLSSEEAGFLQVEKSGLINLKNLILAGVIVGSLGILDDVTVSQTSVVDQLKQSNPNLHFQDLFARGMKVGQDHIASMVNTLVLVYAGASLPLLLLFINTNQTFGDILNLEIIAEEIIKTLVGSIGLIFAAPITTALAAVWYGLGLGKHSTTPITTHTH